MTHTPDLPMARTPREVVASIDGLLSHCIRQNDRIGLFAALYRHLHVALERALAEGRFRHPELVTAVAVDVHDRYAESLRRHYDGGSNPHCWHVAHVACRRASLSVLQHLLMGLVAQTNHDLPLAVASNVPAESFVHFKPDFDEMSSLMYEQVRGTLVHLARTPDGLPMPWRSLGRVNTGWLGFRLTRAQSFAWERAQTVAAARTARTEPGHESAAERVLAAALDAAATQRQKSLRRPAPWRRAALLVLRASEGASVGGQIRKLRGATPGEHDALARSRALRSSRVPLTQAVDPDSFYL